MQNQQWVQLIILAIFAGLSGRGWLYRKMREQQALKRIEDERRRREEEILRTGRDPVARPQTAEAVAEQRRVQEIVARREVELRELRRRQSGGAPRPAGTGEPGILIQIPGTRAPIIVRPIPRGTRMVPPVPAPPTRPPAPQARPARPARSRGTPPASRPGTRRPVPQRKPESSIAPPQDEGAYAQAAMPGAGRPEAPAAPTGTPGSVRPPVVGPAMTPEDWRRAFVMRELLAPPLAVRDPSAQDREPF